MADRATIELMADLRTLWTPTITTIIGYLGVLPMWRDTLPYAVARGVRVLAGSDEQPIGDTWREVVALAEHGGLTPRQALDAAGDPEKGMNLESTFGGGGRRPRRDHGRRRAS